MTERQVQVARREKGAAVDGRAAIFFYFEEANTGLLAIIPGPRGAAELGRFRMPEAMAVDAGRN